MPNSELLEHERVLARGKLLLPRLDLGLARGRERVHDAVDERLHVRPRRCGGKLRALQRVARPALERRVVIVFVFLALLDDRELRHLRRRLGFVVLHNMASEECDRCGRGSRAHAVGGGLKLALHVERERVPRLVDVRSGVLAHSVEAAAVEADQAHIHAKRVVLGIRIALSARIGGKGA